MTLWQATQLRFQPPFSFWAVRSSSSPLQWVWNCEETPVSLPSDTQKVFGWKYTNSRPSISTSIRIDLSPVTDEKRVKGSPSRLLLPCSGFCWSNRRIAISLSPPLTSVDRQPFVECVCMLVQDSGLSKQGFLQWIAALVSCECAQSRIGLFDNRTCNDNGFDLTPWSGKPSHTLNYITALFRHINTILRDL